MIRLPALVARLLDASVARVRRIYWLRGLAATLAALLAAALLVMAVDAYVTLFSDAVRWLLSAVLYASVGAVAWFALARPLRRPLDRLRVAKILDGRHPEHEECLTTLVEVVAEAQAKGCLVCSQALFDILSRKAETAARAIAAEREFTSRTIVRRLRWLAGVAAVLAVSFVLVPQLAGRLFLRAVAPWVDVGNLYANDVEVAPGDAVVLADSTVRITAQLAPELVGVPQIRISRRSALGWGPEFATEMTDGAYEARADLSEPEWRYRINVGPAVTRYYTVRVCEMPCTESFTARIDYPAYAARSPSVVSNEEVGTIAALAGSKVTFALETKPDVQSLLLVGDAVGCEHLMVSNRTVSWSLALRNAEGFQAPLRVGQLRSLPDAAPTVQIVAPAAKTLKLPPYATLPLQIRVSDDVGIRTPELRYRTDAARWRTWRPFAACAQEQPNLWTGEDAVDLAKLDLQGARQVSFDVVVADGCPPELGGPHAVTSMPVVVQLDLQAAGFAQQRIDETVQATHRQLEEAQRQLRASEQAADRAHGKLKWEKRLDDEVVRNVERALQEAEAARRTLTEAERTLQEDARFQPQAEAVRAAREKHVEAALDQLEKAQFASVDERREALEQALRDLRRAQEKLGELDRPLRARAEELARLERLKDLQARQEALARAAEELLQARPDDLNRLEEWKRQQEAAAWEADRLRHEMQNPELFAARSEMFAAGEKMEQLRRELENAQDLAKDEAQRARRAEELARERQARQEQAVRQADEHARRAEELMRQAAREPHRSEDLMRQAEGQQLEALQQLEHAEAPASMKELAAHAAEETRKATDADLPKDEARAAASKLRRALDAARKDAEESRIDRDLANAQAAQAARAEEDRKNGQEVNPWTKKELARVADEAAKHAARRTDEAAQATDRASEAQREMAEALSKETPESDRAAVEAAERAAEALANAPVPQALRDRQEEVLEAARDRLRQRAAGEKAAEMAAEAAALTEQAQKSAQAAEAAEKQATAAQEAAAQAQESALAFQERALSEKTPAAQTRANEAQASAAAAQQQAQEAERASERARTDADAARRQASQAQEAAARARGNAQAQRQAQAAAEAASQAEAARAEMRRNRQEAQQAASEAQAEAAAAQQDAVRAQEKGDAEQVELAQEAARDAENRAWAAQRRAVRGTDGSEGPVAVPADSSSEADAVTPKTVSEALAFAAEAALQQAEELSEAVDAAVGQEDFAAAQELAPQAAAAQARAAEALARIRRDPALPSEAVRALGEAQKAELHAAAQQRSAGLHAARVVAHPGNGHERWQTKSSEQQSRASQQAASAAFQTARRAVAEARSAAAARAQQEQTPQGQTPSQQAAAAARMLAGQVARQSRAMGLSGGVSAANAEGQPPAARSDWFRIQGSAKEGLGVRALESVPSEYRELVRGYFLKLAEEAK